ncbi:MAG: hypothetical protein RJQ00_12730 [Vicingaceae bacterium]
MSIAFDFMRFFILLGSFALCFSAQAQLSPIGTWTDHLPYRFGTSIAVADNIIYCGTETGLFSFNINDNSISKFSKVNLLNDVGILKIAHSNSLNKLIVVYNNANIDLITSKGVTNIPFIKNSSEEGTINEIKLEGNIAYLSFNFGIVALDISKEEIKDTYKFSSGGEGIFVNSTEQIGDTLYAATNQGYYAANVNQNLLDFNSWKRQDFKSNTTIKILNELGGNLILVTTDIDDNDSLFVRKQNKFESHPNYQSQKIITITSLNNNGIQILTEASLAELNPNGDISNETPINNNTSVGAVSKNDIVYLVTLRDPLVLYTKISGELRGAIKPNGPSDKDIFDMDFKNGNLWGANGGHSSTYGNSFRGLEIYHLKNGQWNSFSSFSLPILNDLFDVLSVTIDPRNDDVYFGMLGNGMLRYRGNNSFVKFDTSNSSLSIREALASFNWIGTGESYFDDDFNLWIANTFSVNSLAVRKANGSWKSFDFNDFLRSAETAIHDVIVTDEGYKWIALPKDDAILVFDDNGTIDNTSDDRTIKLVSSPGLGNIPTGRGIKMEKDLNGLVWIGTADGVAVHFNPSGVFEIENRDFDRIIFNDGENNEILLKNVPISDIAINGANQKWIGTETSGVLLLSEDGKETLASFNEDNSPLFSNTINAITIDQETGEVYFGTSEGIISYRGAVAEGKENFTEVKVFPNPVRPNYTGPITISGLMNNTTVKITDINGGLIRELESEGGQVLWDGNNFNGRRASTGVYLIFNSAESEIDNLKTQIGKIMFVN